MDNQKADEQGRHSAGFLLAEYQHHRDEFRHSEEVGETRVNFFITITTAVLGALAIREKGIWADAAVDPVFFYGLGALLLFGVVTLMRLIRRNLESHKHLRALGRIRRYFTDRDQQILPHLYFEPRDDRPYRKKEWRQIFSLGTGGLVETTSLVNSFIVAAFCALLAAPSGWIVGGLSGLAGFIAAWIVEFIYVKGRYDKEKPTTDEIRFPGN